MGERTLQAQAVMKLPAGAALSSPALRDYAVALINNNPTFASFVLEQSQSLVKEGSSPKRVRAAMISATLAWLVERGFVTIEERGGEPVLARPVTRLPTKQELLEVARAEREPAAVPRDEDVLEENSSAAPAGELASPQAPVSDDNAPHVFTTGLPHLDAKRRAELLAKLEDPQASDREIMRLFGYASYKDGPSGEGIFGNLGISREELIALVRDGKMSESMRQACARAQQMPESWKVEEEIKNRQAFAFELALYRLNERGLKGRPKSAAARNEAAREHLRAVAGLERYEKYYAGVMRGQELRARKAELSALAEAGELKARGESPVAAEERAAAARAEAAKSHAFLYESARQGAAAFRERAQAHPESAAAAHVRADAYVYEAFELSSGYRDHELASADARDAEVSSGRWGFTGGEELSGSSEAAAALSWMPEGRRETLAYARARASYEKSEAGLCRRYESRRADTSLDHEGRKRLGQVAASRVSANATALLELRRGLTGDLSGVSQEERLAAHGELVSQAAVVAAEGGEVSRRVELGVREDASERLGRDFLAQSESELLAAYNDAQERRRELAAKLKKSGGERELSAELRLAEAEEEKAYLDFKMKSQLREGKGANEFLVSRYVHESAALEEELSSRQLELCRARAGELEGTTAAEREAEGRLAAAKERSASAKEGYEAVRKAAPARAEALRRDELLHAELLRGLGGESLETMLTSVREVSHREVLWAEEQVLAVPVLQEVYERHLSLSEVCNREAAAFLEARRDLRASLADEGRLAEAAKLRGERERMIAGEESRLSTDDALDLGTGAWRWFVDAERGEAKVRDLEADLTSSARAEEELRSQAKELSARVDEGEATLRAGLVEQRATLAKLDATLDEEEPPAQLVSSAVHHGRILELAGGYAPEMMEESLTLGRSHLDRAFELSRSEEERRFTAVGYQEFSASSQVGMRELSWSQMERPKLDEATGRRALCAQEHVGLLESAREVYARGEELAAEHAGDEVVTEAASRARAARESLLALSSTYESFLAAANAQLARGSESARTSQRAGMERNKQLQKEVHGELFGTLLGYAAAPFVYWQDEARAEAELSAEERAQQEALAVFEEGYRLARGMGESEALAYATSSLGMVVGRGRKERLANGFATTSMLEGLPLSEESQKLVASYREQVRSVRQEPVMVAAGVAAAPVARVSTEELVRGPRLLQAGEVLRENRALVSSLRATRGDLGAATARLESSWAPTAQMEAVGDSYDFINEWTAEVPAAFRVTQRALGVTVSVLAPALLAEYLSVGAGVTWAGGALTRLGAAPLAASTQGLVRAASLGGRLVLRGTGRALTASAPYLESTAASESLLAMMSRSSVVAGVLERQAIATTMRVGLRMGVGYGHMRALIAGKDYAVSGMVARRGEDDLWTKLVRESLEFIEVGYGCSLSRVRGAQAMTQLWNMTRFSLLSTAVQDVILPQVRDPNRAAALGEAWGELSPLLAVGLGQQAKWKMSRKQARSGLDGPDGGGGGPVGRATRLEVESEFTHARFSHDDVAPLRSSELRALKSRLDATLARNRGEYGSEAEYKAARAAVDKAYRQFAGDVALDRAVQGDVGLRWRLQHGALGEGDLTRLRLGSETALRASGLDEEEVQTAVLLRLGPVWSERLRSLEGAELPLADLEELMRLPQAPGEGADGAQAYTAYARMLLALGVSEEVGKVLALQATNQHLAREMARAAGVTLDAAGVAEVAAVAAKLTGEDDELYATALSALSRLPAESREKLAAELAGRELWARMLTRLAEGEVGGEEAHVASASTQPRAGPETPAPRGPIARKLGRITQNRDLLRVARQLDELAPTLARGFVERSPQYLRDCCELATRGVPLLVASRLSDSAARFLASNLDTFYHGTFYLSADREERYRGPRGSDGRLLPRAQRLAVEKRARIVDSKTQWKWDLFVTLLRVDLGYKRGSALATEVFEAIAEVIPKRHWRQIVTQVSSLERGQKMLETLRRGRFAKAAYRELSLWYQMPTNPELVPPRVREIMQQPSGSINPSAEETFPAIVAWLEERWESSRSSYNNRARRVSESPFAKVELGDDAIPGLAHWPRDIQALLEGLHDDVIQVYSATHNSAKSRVGYIGRPDRGGMIHGRTVGQAIHVGERGKRRSATDQVDTFVHELDHFERNFFYGKGGGAEKLADNLVGEALAFMRPLYELDPSKLAKLLTSQLELKLWLMNMYRNYSRDEVVGSPHFLGGELGEKAILLASRRILAVAKPGEGSAAERAARALENFGKVFANPDHYKTLTGYEKYHTEEATPFVDGRTKTVRSLPGLGKEAYQELLAAGMEHREISYLVKHYGWDKQTVAKARELAELLDIPLRSISDRSAKTLAVEHEAALKIAELEGARVFVRGYGTKLHQWYQIVHLSFLYPEISSYFKAEVVSRLSAQQLAGLNWILQYSILLSKSEELLVLDHARLERLSRMTVSDLMKVSQRLEAGMSFDQAIGFGQHAQAWASAPTPPPRDRHMTAARADDEGSTVPRAAGGDVLPFVTRPPAVLDEQEAAAYALALELRSEGLTHARIVRRLIDECGLTIARAVDIARAQQGYMGVPDLPVRQLVIEELQPQPEALPGALPTGHRWPRWTKIRSPYLHLRRQISTELAHAIDAHLDAEEKRLSPQAASLEVAKMITEDNEVAKLSSVRFAKQYVAARSAVRLASQLARDSRPLEREVLKEHAQRLRELDAALASLKLDPRVHERLLFEVVAAAVAARLDPIADPDSYKIVSKTFVEYYRAIDKNIPANLVLDFTIRTQDASVGTPDF